MNLNVPVFNWKDLDGLTLTIRVVEDDGVMLVMGFDEIGSCYVLQEVVTTER